MSEWLIDALGMACREHGVNVARRGPKLRAGRDLTLEARVVPRPTLNGTAQVRIDFVVESPLLPGLPMLDSFAGVGATRDEAEENALGKFLQGSLHVLLEALGAHRCDGDQVEWEEWTGADHAWRVCIGPLLTIATRKGEHIESFAEFFEPLTARFSRDIGAGPHWMRVFLGAVNGGRAGGEVLIDGENWPAGQQLLDAHPWVYPPGYASFRLLAIALPKDL